MSAPFLLNEGKMESDLDANFHRIINLDTSNLPPSGIPPTIHPDGNFWLHDWDSETLTWTTKQPSFSNLLGSLTTTQQQRIIILGTISQGVWQGSLIGSSYLPTLEDIRPPADNLSMASKRITNLAMPVDLGDAVNMQFVDAAVEGLHPKEAVRAASTARLVLSTLRNPVDGVTLQAGDRVLVKNQGEGVLAKANGIYIASTGNWTRATDSDSASELDKAYVIALEGDINELTGWFQSEPSPVPGTDEINYFIFSGVPNVIAGAGLGQTGHEIFAVGTDHRISIGAGIDIANDYIGQTSITKLGTITVGTWHGTILQSDFGGTGVDNNGKTLSLGIDLLANLQGTGSPTSSLEFRVNSGASSVLVPASGVLATLSNAETFTNKRISPRTGTVASNTAPTINTDTTDVFTISALAVNITSMTTNLSGTPIQGQRFTLWLKDSGVARNIIWGSKWLAGTGLTDPALPLITFAGKWTLLNFTWNSTLAQWILTSKVSQI